MDVGDKVTWKSQSGGFEIIKTGIIEAIVPAGVSANKCIPEGFKCNSKAGYGSYRDHQSYLVRVFGRDSLGNQTYGSRGLYWPVVANLKLVMDKNRGGGLCGTIRDLENQVRALQLEIADLRNRLDRYEK